MNIDRIGSHIREALRGALTECALPGTGPLPAALASALIARATAALVEDLEAFVARDPASHGKARVILDGYASFAGMLHYRLAHLVWTASVLEAEQRMALAHRISGRGKLCSGADIHPGATIGARFILDHGHGTVIGETCRIGADCYILNNVTLGSSGIANNPNGMRHPQIGDAVEIGAHVRVLGPVQVGDGVFIGPNCLVRSDVPAGSRVRIVNQLQIDSLPGQRRSPLMAYACSQRLHVVGTDATGFAVDVVDAEFAEVAGLSLLRTGQVMQHVEYAITRLGRAARPCDRNTNLRLSLGSDTLYMIDPPGLGDLVARAYAAAPIGRDALMLDDKP